ncbi:hypothetical protein TH63_18945 [Rufibacter radiotolerans]|uniref:Uncharacterized protein n=1 Tax=Rufibacter radiotolerans TaxID=1379910 RepID=A0A0H4VTH6_9BACT|nr:hypothetical protein [Rufibacter radiotolerans]AKQ47247.1 hypothetical protein TH63_18945 [Rufibacter radiotolerans]
MYKLLDFLTLLLNIRTTRNTTGAKPWAIHWFPKIWPVLRLTFLLLLGGFGLLFLTSFLTDAYFKEINTGKKIDSLSRVIVHYRQNHSVLPANLPEAVANDPQKRDLTRDSWGNQIHYLVQQQSRTFTLTSAGKDQQLFTADDLTLRVEVGSTI